MESNTSSLIVLINLYVINLVFFLSRKFLKFLNCFLVKYQLILQFGYWIEKKNKFQKGQNKSK